MREKVLLSNTIIPAHLYVERAADRQLRSIIEKMGRPGYVLVSRQMGKTNLLINMKREYSSEIVLYLDLSIRLDSPRAWFRHVIDSLIDSHESELGHLFPKIEFQRKELDLEPNVEYERHLRMILRETPKKVIIILDEIDSLVNTPYSDTILAQVRSMYFSRVNYGEFNRLTYVLSGVAEPTDLIKDKNISPFNIGEKIYLDDFTREEFWSFLQKAKTTDSEEIGERIFEWTNGNPRMTWDVCSELEDRAISGAPLNIEIVDEVVQKLYLRDLDRAPIDHIRTLVESDPQIRDAIMSIRFGHHDYVDDKVRSKLYLAGITRNAAGGTIDIKNKIIDSALSDRWLAQITYSQKTLLAEASANYVAGRYEHAIYQFELALDDNAYRELVTPNDIFQLALSHFWLGELEKAAGLLEQCIEKTTDTALTQATRHYLGLASIAMGDFTAALDHLKSASSGPDIGYKLESSLHLISTYLKVGTSRHGQDALDLSQQLLTELSELPALDPDVRRELVASALYNKSIVHLAMKERNSAIECLNSAIEQASADLQPALLLALHGLLENPSEKSSLIVKAAQAIISNDLGIQEGNTRILGLRGPMIGQILSHLAEQDNLDKFMGLSEYVTQKIYEGKKSELSALIDIFQSFESEDDRLVHNKLISQAVKTYNSDSLSQHERLSLYRFLAALCDTPESPKWCARFIQELKATTHAEAISEDDVYALLHSLHIFRIKKKPEYVSELLDVWADFGLAATAKHPTISSFILLHLMNHLKESGDLESALHFARTLMKLLDSESLLSSAHAVHKEAFTEMRRQATAFLKSSKANRNPYKNIGRNQRVLVQYGESEPVLKKFKQAQADLLEERCTLIRIETEE